MADTRPDYEAFYNAFKPADLSAEFDGSFTTGLNACTECVDRHPANARAARYERADGTADEMTFGELKESTSRFANLLTSHGVLPGDRVAALLPRGPELLTVIFGALRAGAVYQPLFTAFGPKAIAQRLGGSHAKVVVTDATNRPKLNDVENSPLIVTIDASDEDDLDFVAALGGQSNTFDAVLRQAEDQMLMMFTSGTTGPPKGVAVPHAALLSFLAYMRYGIDLQPADSFWNIADPGWAYGLYYAVIGPLISGNATILIDGVFSLERTCDVVRKYNVTNFAGAPTAYRMMIADGETVPDAIRGRLRVASSAGEPLNPEVMRWFDEKLNCPLHDHYGQTEVAMMLLNHHALKHPIRPGSAGFPMPGWSLAVVNDDGVEVADGEQGVLAIHRSKSPLMFFAGYEGREGQDWVGDYYLTGDSVEKNDDGSYSFVGRNDDLISTAGYRVGPFDVESCLLEHEAVLESGVVGKPDAERGHIVKAFIVLHGGQNASDELSEELRLHVRTRLGGHAYPREIAFVSELPKTPSGKIQRFMLRDQA
jgi:acetyl-CoA synthetase